MMKQGLILLAVAVYCSAIRDGRGHYSKKNTFQSSSTEYSAEAKVKPSPYSFNYAADLEDGHISRSESADGNGKVVGSYSLGVADGRQRTVDYIADERGFRATVNTNEFGTKNGSPVDVQFNSPAVSDEPKVYSPPHAYRPQTAAAAAAASSSSMYSQSAFSHQVKPVQSFQPSPYASNYDAAAFGGSSSSEESSDDNAVDGTVKSDVPVAPVQQVIVQAPESRCFPFCRLTSMQPKTSMDSEKTVDAPAAPNQPEAFKAPSFPQLTDDKASGSVDMYKMSHINQQKVEPVQSFQPSPYAFSYDAEATGGSSSRKESSDASGTVTGSYEVRHEDGSVRIVEYIADKNGFRANVKTDEVGTKSGNPADVTVKSDAPVAPVQQAPAQDSEIRCLSMSCRQPSTDSDKVADVPAAPNHPATFKAPSSPQLTDHRVSGSVEMHKMSYANHQKVEPVQPFQSSPSFNNGVEASSGSSFRKESSDNNLADVTVKPHAPVVPVQQTSAAFPHKVIDESASGSHVQVEPVQTFQPSPYAFSYDAEATGGSSSRKESSDASGTVTGSYEVRHEDGSVRIVDYIADKDGFRANVRTEELRPKSDNPADVTVKPDVIVVPVEQDSVQSQESRCHPLFCSQKNMQPKVSMNSEKTVDAPVATKQPIAFNAQSLPQFPDQSASGSIVQVEPVQSVQPSPYAFSYDAEASGGSSSRKESSDGSGTVTGSYKVRHEDGSVRIVDYIADKNGFRANVKTEETGSKSDNPADVTIKPDVPLPPVQSAVQQASDHSMESRCHPFCRLRSMQPKTNTQREITADAPANPEQQTAFNGPSIPQVIDQKASGSFAQVEPVQSVQPSPYAFSYDAEATGGSSSRKESSDASGTVTGSYEVRHEDGSVRIVDYIADKDGFRANVKTDEAGTKSDNPADVTVKSDAPVAPVHQPTVQQASDQVPESRCNTLLCRQRSMQTKTSMISQKTIDAWSR